MLTRTRARTRTRTRTRIRTRTNPRTDKGYDKDEDKGVDMVKEMGKDKEGVLSHPIAAVARAFVLRSVVTVGVMLCCSVSLSNRIQTKKCEI